MFIITIVTLLIDATMALMVRIAINELTVYFQLELFWNCTGGAAFPFLHVIWFHVTQYDINFAQTQEDINTCEQFILCQEEKLKINHSHILVAESISHSYRRRTELFPKHRTAIHKSNIGFSMSALITDDTMPSMRNLHDSSTCCWKH